MTLKASLKSVEQIRLSQQYDSVLVYKLSFYGEIADYNLDDLSQCTKQFNKNQVGQWYCYNSNI